MLAMAPSSLALRLAAVVLVAAPMGACQTVETGNAPTGPPSTSVSPATSATLTGNVVYRQRIALPPDAVVKVMLLDISRADAPAVTLSQQTIPTNGKQVPIPFRLAYTPQAIDARHRYAVRAEIRTAGGTLAWTTDTVHPALTNGAPLDGIEVNVVQVLEGPSRPPTLGMTGALALAGTSWTLDRAETASGTVRPQGGQVYTVAFDANGRYNGQADCNRFLGDYTVDGAQLTLNAGPTTLAACAPGSFERDFLQTLLGAMSVEQMPGMLHVRGTNGITLMLVAR